MNLNDALAVIAALLPVLIPLGMFAYRLLLSQLPAAKAAAIASEIHLVVSAVEQTFKALPGSGKQKKEEALRIVGSLGLKVDPQRLDLLIESAVAALPSALPK